MQIFFCVVLNAFILSSVHNMLSNKKKNLSWDVTQNDQK